MSEKEGTEKTIDCRITGCSSPVIAKGLCSYHYYREHRALKKKKIDVVPYKNQAGEQIAEERSLCLVLTLDLNPEMSEGLKRAADQHYRTIEGQAMAIVHAYLVSNNLL